MGHEPEQARLIAERVSRRVAAVPGSGAVEGSPRNTAPVREELSAIRSGLHDLEQQLDRIESKIVQSGSAQTVEQPRARLINFVSSSPPSLNPPLPTPANSPSHSKGSEFIPLTQSPWLASMSSMYSSSSHTGENYPQSAPRNVQLVSHPSQERFGVEEATVAELVEFFENEKKCSVDPSGKPCDHCAMCSSRGF
jgi:hypothetical protein